MKIKASFVTNSSSASVVISRKKLTEVQEFMIKNHITSTNMFMELSNYKQKKTSKNFVKIITSVYELADSWIVDFRKRHIVATTLMDNFAFYVILNYLRIPMNQYLYYSGDHDYDFFKSGRGCRKKFVNKNFFEVLQSPAPSKGNFTHDESENIILELGRLVNIKTPCDQCIVNFNCKHNDIYSSYKICEDALIFFEKFLRKHIKNYGKRRF